MHCILSPVHQPIVDLDNGGIFFYEALARLRDDTTKQGHIHLIQIGEEFGFIEHVDMAMLDHAAEDLQHTSHSISVNVAARTVDQAWQHLIAILDSQKVAHYDRLILELTETMAIQQPRNLLSLASWARERGVRFAVDDFGSGYSDVDLVLHLKPEIVKLDGALVEREMQQGDPKGFLAMLATIIETGAAIVAEKIDSKLKRDWVRDCGIRYGQGYLLGEPGWHLRQPAGAGRAECVELSQPLVSFA